MGLRRLAPYRDAEWNVPTKVRKRAVKELRHKLREDLLVRAPELIDRKALAEAVASGRGDDDDELDGGHARDARQHSEEEPDGPAAENERTDEPATGSKRKRVASTGVAAGAGAAAAAAAPAPLAATAAAVASTTHLASEANDSDRAPKKQRRRRGHSSQTSDRSGRLATQHAKPGAPPHARGAAGSDVKVKLPSGAALPKSRLAAYGLL